MKKLLLILFSTLIIGTDSFAVDSNGKFNYAAGVIVGTTNGINTLAYDGEGRGYQLTLSVNPNADSKIALAFDKLFFYDANSTIPVYAGIGVKISDTPDKYIGIRAVFGISYFVSSLDDSLEIYAEAVPTIYLTALSDFLIPDYGIGARYYF